MKFLFDQFYLQFLCLSVGCFAVGLDQKRNTKEFMTKYKIQRRLETDGNILLRRSPTYDNHSLTNKKLKWPNFNKLPCSKFCFCSQSTVSCQGRKLKKIPLIKGDDLKLVTIQQSQIRVLENKDFREMFFLHELQLSDNKVHRIGNETFVDLINLEVLNLSNNKLPDISRNVFRHLVTLKELNLNNNLLVTVEEALGFLANLHVLRLSGNKIKIVGSRAFYGNSQVRTLDLSWNRIASIDRNAFTRMTSLTTLLLDHNPIEELDVYLKLNLFLEQLDVARCNLKQVLKETPRQLKDLRLSGNKITTVGDEDFVNPNAIQLLLLNDNKIEHLSDSAFDYMPLLHDLYLNKNRLTKLPRSMPTKLYSLYASHNRITTLNWRSFSKKYNLHYLVLSHNKISHIDPNAMRNLLFLTHLDLSYNNLKYLRTGMFGRATNLERLDLSHNPLHVLEPGSFMGLKKLHILKMASTGGSSDMDSSVFLDLIKLQYLDLSNSSKLATKLILSPSYGYYIESVRNLNLINTGMKYLPIEIKSNLANLTTVRMTNNPWHCNKRMLWVKDWIRTSSVDFYEPEKLICKSPPRLRGRRIVDLTFFDAMSSKTSKKRRKNRTKASNSLKERWRLLNKTLMEATKNRFLFGFEL